MVDKVRTRTSDDHIRTACDFRRLYARGQCSFFVEWAVIERRTHVLQYSGNRGAGPHERILPSETQRGLRSGIFDTGVVFSLWTRRCGSSHMPLIHQARQRVCPHGVGLPSCWRSRPTRSRYDMR